MTQTTDNLQLLKLSEIAAEINADYERLRTYADVPGVKEFLNAQPLKGSKGVGYPPEAVPIFARILADANAGRVQPKTLAAYLQTLHRENEPGNAIVPSGQSPDPFNIAALSQIPAEHWALLARYTAALEQHARVLDAHTRALNEQPPDDKLLPLSRAQHEYGLSLLSLRALRVKDGRRWKVRRSDVLRAIQSLQTT